MEKINKEELMKRLNLTEEELEKVAAGDAGLYRDCHAVLAAIEKDSGYCAEHGYDCLVCCPNFPFGC